MKKTVVVMLLICIVTVGVVAQHVYTESEYQQAIVNDRFVGGEQNVYLPPNMYPDISTPTHMIEVDFIGKREEGLGQALLYSAWGCKLPGLVVILDEDWARIDTYKINLSGLIFAIQRHNIPMGLWVMYPDLTSDHILDDGVTCGYVDWTKVVE